MTEIIQRSRIERKRQVRQRLGVGHSFFDDNIVLRDSANPHVPGIARSDGAPIPRLKPVPLGAHAVGFFAEDTDALLDALRDARRSPKATRRSAGRQAQARGKVTASRKTDKNYSDAESKSD
jgi:hypothetical protein